MNFKILILLKIMFLMVNLFLIIVNYISDKDNLLILNSIILGMLLTSVFNDIKELTK